MISVAKVSFVVPIYNVEKYLPRLADSLKNQTMSDFEALLVNDGSTDLSGKICEDIVAGDSRFRLISKENGGVASARNAALDAAVGDYVVFVDPDDWIEPDSLEILTGTADRERADIVMFGMHNDTVDENGELLKTFVTAPSFAGVYKDHPCKRIFDKLATAYLITTKLVRRSFIEKYHCRFPDMHIGEDGVFCLTLFGNDPECLAVLDVPLYHYTIARKTSLSNSYHPERLKNNFILSNLAWDTVEKWGLLQSPMHLKSVRYCTVRDLQISIKNISLSPMPFLERRRWLKETVKQERISSSVKHTPVSMSHSRNDRIKLMLLKAHMYSAVIIASGLNQRS